ncbi:hypothetical protein NE467_11220 [Bacteroides thetaiotaomicron]|nr:hypothetical protein [Bacteroides thetaiotaomicron]MCQ5206519.1 hypothetical protein [Bacteroides thetaiotaomicron]
MAQLCHYGGTVVPKARHKHAKGVARTKHTFYSSFRYAFPTLQTGPL